jgi:hypothetical protein
LAKPLRNFHEERTAPSAARPAHITVLGRLHPQLSPQKDVVQLRAQSWSARYLFTVSSALLLDRTTA